jgi:hypothetical protein
MKRLLIIVCAAATAAVVASPRVAAGGPPAGLSQDGLGITSPDGNTRYLALTSGKNTLVEAVNVHDGSLRNYVSLSGVFGIPAIGWTATGLTADGKELVLTTYPWLRNPTFLVLRVPDFTTRALVSLKGSWSYDAISPRGRTLYLIQALSSLGSERYLVRAYDLHLGRLVKRVIADRRDAEFGPMTGSAVTRASSSDGSWAYTLYTRPNGTGFVHALDTVHRQAVCIDLPWKDLTTWSYDVRLWLSRDGTKLHLRQVGAGGRSAVIDTRTWKLKVSSPV